MHKDNLLLAQAEFATYLFYIVVGIIAALLIWILIAILIEQVRRFIRWIKQKKN
jgi:uncharacterized membrane protein YuzA (DUF378 family)